MKKENNNSISPFYATSMWNNLLSNIEPHFLRANGATEQLKLINKFFTHSDLANQRYYDYSCNLLYNFLVADGAKNYLDKVQSDFDLDVRSVKLNNHKLNWDILTAFYTLWRLHKKLPNLFTAENLVIAELGSGNGKHAHVLANLNPSIKFMCFDLPLPLLVAEQVLKSRLVSMPIYTYPINFYEEINPDSLTSGVYLFGSHHLANVRSHSIDVFINTSSFQEMTKRQVSEYLQILGSKCRGSIFLQNYWKHKRQHKKFGNILGWDEYIFPNNMKLESLEDAVYSNRYFEAFLRINK